MHYIWSPVHIFFERSRDLQLQKKKYINKWSRLCRKLELWRQVHLTRVTAYSLQKQNQKTPSKQIKTNPAQTFVIYLLLEAHLSLPIQVSIHPAGYPTSAPGRYPCRPSLSQEGVVHLGLNWMCSTSRTLWISGETDRERKAFQRHVALKSTTFTPERSPRKT